MTDPFKSKKHHRSVRWGLIVQILVFVGLFVGALVITWFVTGQPTTPVEPIQPHMRPGG